MLLSTENLFYATLTRFLSGFAWLLILALSACGGDAEINGQIAGSDNSVIDSGRASDTGTEINDNHHVDPEVGIVAKPDVVDTAADTAVVNSNNGCSATTFNTTPIAVPPGNLTNAFCGDSATDGEGCAEWLGPEYLTAGEANNWRIRFKAGDSGIAAGGGVSVGFHHASDWAIQNSNPLKENYVSVTDGFDLSTGFPMPAGMFGREPGVYNPDGIFHKIVVATATRPVAAGEEIVFHFGAGECLQTTQIYVDEDHELRVATDIDGDGLFKGLALGSPKFSIRAAPEATINAIIPSQVLVNSPFEVQIRIEDQYHNLASSYINSVNLLDEHGVTVASGVQIQNGVGSATVRLNSVGAHRLRIVTPNSNLQGRSNPIRVFNTAPDRKIYWGELHGHTGVSDGLGLDANEYFEFGCEIAALDFVALTDHGTQNWEANIEAVKHYHQPGKCLTILASETSSRSNPKDHNNIYYRADDAPPLPVWYFDYAGFLENVHLIHNHTTNTAFTGPHHSGYHRDGEGDPLYPFGAWDARTSRTFEVYSSHGTSEYQGNPRALVKESSDPLKYMHGGLAAGHKFAVIAASDNHDSKPGRSPWGRYKGGLTGVWAESLSRDSIFDAIWNYQTYGTSFDRIYVDFSVNGQSMGSTTNNGSNQIKFFVIGKTDNITVNLVRNEVDIKTWTTENGVLDVQHTDTSAGSYYYLRVTQDNGERAWSTPVWTE